MLFPGLPNAFKAPAAATSCAVVLGGGRVVVFVLGAVAAAVFNAPSAAVS